MFTEEAVDADLFGEELGEGRLVAFLLSSGDAGADLALTAFEVAALEEVEGVFDQMDQRFGLGARW